MVGNALVDMYVKFNAMTKAQAAFDAISARNVVTWTTLIAGYAQYGYGEEALKCYELMQEQGIPPNTFTFACILKACGSIGGDSKGRHIHAEIIHEKLPEKDVRVGTALVDLYAKCGSVTTAREVFDRLPLQDLVAWNSLMRGYAQIGENDVVFDLFNRMVKEGTKPDHVSFSIALNACCHSGLIGKGDEYFEMMKLSYGLVPTLDHYTCMIGLYGRAGQFDKCMALIDEMPFPGDFSMWSTLLGACQKWGNVKLARFAFEQAIQLDDKNALSYICMNNIYISAGMQEEANKIEAKRLEKRGNV
jgi:pentatricopeptide repeat protein